MYKFYLVKVDSNGAEREVLKDKVYEFPTFKIEDRAMCAAFTAWMNCIIEDTRFLFGEEYKYWFTYAENSEKVDRAFPIF